MKRLLVLGLLTGALAGGAPAPAASQDAPPPPQFLPVGQMAPDVQVTGATRHGVLREPVRLSDLKGETVVLAFFFRARTRG